LQERNAIELEDDHLNEPKVKLERVAISEDWSFWSSGDLIQNANKTSLKKGVHRSAELFFCLDRLIAAD
jgi:hypothetical protein